MKKIILIVLLLIIAGFFGYQYLYQDHRDIENETAEFTLDATRLIGEFVTDMETASSKYLNKTIIIRGKVTEIEEMAITLDKAIYCIFDEKNDLSSASEGIEVKIKGRCIGYDELLEVIKLDPVSYTHLTLPTTSRV